MRDDPVDTAKRAVLANKIGAELAVAAKPDGALHVAFHGEINAFFGHASVVQRAAI